MLALLTHTVLTLDVHPELRMGERKTHIRVRVLNFHLRQKIPEPLQKSFPRPAGALAPSPKAPQPHPQHLVSKRLHALLVARHCVVLGMSADHLRQPLRRLPGRLVHLLPQLLPNILQLRRHAFAYGLPVYDELPRLVVLSADMGEPGES